MIIRMSNAGRCLRAQSAELLGFTPRPSSPALESAAEEGKLHERAVKAGLLKEGYSLFDEQLKLVMPFENFVLVGHIDGKVIHVGADTPLLLEIKSMSQGEFDRWIRTSWEGFPIYAAQISLYMHATKLNCLYIVKNRNTGFKDRQVLTHQPIGIINVLAGIKDMIYDVNAGLGLYDGEFDPWSTECKRCAFREQTCFTPNTQEPTAADRAELDNLVELWRAGDALTQDGEEKKEQAKIRIKEVMKALETEKLTHNRLNISIIHRRNESWNSKYLKSILLPEQIEEAVKITESAYARIIDLEERGK